MIHPGERDRRQGRRAVRARDRAARDGRDGQVRAASTSARSRRPSRAVSSTASRGHGLRDATTSRASARSRSAARYDGETFFLEVPSSCPRRPNAPTVAKLWARARIRDLERASLTGRRAEAMKERIVERSRSSTASRRSTPRSSSSRSAPAIAASTAARDARRPGERAGRLGDVQGLALVKRSTTAARSSAGARALRRRPEAG